MHTFGCDSNKNKPLIFFNSQVKLFIITVTVNINFELPVLVGCQR